jgi:multiple sugar transport system substrate-binding protein
MAMTRARTIALIVFVVLVAACGDGGTATTTGGTGGGTATTTGGTGGDTATTAAAGGEATGPITIWYSNNAQEIEWATAQIEAWNADHPDEEVTAQEIPAGETSEAVIAASITAGNTPCLIYNTAPAAVPSFQQQQGLVALNEFEDGASFIEERGGEAAAQYQSPDGSYYQMPWKTNPVMILYNTALFEEAGIDSENPPLGTYEDFASTAATIVDSGAAEAAIYPSPTSQFFQSWFDFYPWFAAETGQPLVVDGEAQFNTDEGKAIAEVWRQLYADGLVPQEESQVDAFAEGVSAMNSAGPWAVAVYTDVEWAVVPPPTSGGTAAEDLSTFADGKSVGLYTSCENRGTAWEFLKFTMSEEADRQLLEITGQMPFRPGITDLYADFFDENPGFLPFAEQVERVIEVPSVPNSVEVWQTFRDAWSSSVIFGDEEIDAAFQQAADTINQLASE